MSTDYGPAQWVPSSHFWGGRGGNTPKWIILHGTAGGTSATAIANYFKTDDPPTSAHYIVGLNGEVVQCVSEADSAWANGVVTQGHDPWWSTQLNPNFVTFSIEHVKPDSGNQSQLTDAQKQASFALVKHLCDKYNIPKRQADAQGGVTGHYSIDPVNRSQCPGPYPWQELWTYLGGTQTTTPTATQTTGVPSGWTDDGTTLVAPNGNKVVLGFRWYVLNNAWPADNWPLENEHYTPVLDVTNPSLGAGEIQHFRQTILAWPQNSNQVVELWAGANALTWEQQAQNAQQSSQQAQQLQQQIQQLQQQLAAARSAQAAPSPVVTSTASPISQAPAAPYIPPMPSAQRASSAMPAPSTQSQSGMDPVTQRITGVEQQLQALIGALGANPQTSKLINQMGKDLNKAGQELSNPQVQRSLLKNPKSLLRWILMIIGVLFSDAVAWAASTFLHHTTTLPVPFLTIGTVLLSGAMFLGAFRFQKS